ncbi:hypothetical protein WA158_005607 [Blastocystis sp. Blastoise]
MKFISLLFLIISAVAFTTQYNGIAIENSTFIYRNFFMYDKTTSPKISPPGNGESYIISDFKISKIDKNVNHGQGNVESLIVSKKFFESIGYTDVDESTNKSYQVVCCDQTAVDAGKCSQIGSLILPKNMEGQFAYNRTEFKGTDTEIYVKFDVPAHGQYMMVIGICDVEPNKNMLLDGFTTAMNPYGHLPGAHYGKLPFEKYIVTIYVILIIIWFVRCFYYKTEIMSIQNIVSVVLIIFAIENIFELVNLSAYNLSGELDFTMNMAGLIVSTLTRTVSRILTLEIAMGLGISKPTIGTNAFKIYALAIVFFILAFWESYASTFSPNYEINYFRILPASLVDAIWYFWIVLSLLDTLQELEDKKQSAKLEMFLKFRNLVIAALIVSSVYTVIFGYIFIDESIEIDWRYQWFFNEGIWTIFYLVVLIYVLKLWAPNENSAAYAYHMQISTEERQDTEEYAMQDTLQGPNSVSIKITTVSQDELKPMQIKEVAN